MAAETKEVEEDIHKLVEEEDILREEVDILRVEEVVEQVEDVEVEARAVVALLVVEVEEEEGQVGEVEGEKSLFEVTSNNKLV